MWFKNLRIYRFSDPITIEPDMLTEQLNAHIFQPCGRQDQSSYGWVPPLARLGEELVHTVGGRMMICTRKDDKVLPATLVKELVEERIATIRQNDGRSVGRRERLTLKEEVVQELLPRALTKSERLYAYIDTLSGHILVNSASAAKAELLLGALRKALGSLPVVPVQTQLSPAQVMSDWLLGEAALPSSFELGVDCLMQETQAEGGSIVFKRQPLQEQEITNHLAAGMRVQQLALQWQGGISAVVDSELTIRKLKFEDNILEHSASAEDAMAQFDQDFAVMGLELSHFLAALLSAFGGEHVDGPDATAQAFNQSTLTQEAYNEAAEFEASPELAKKPTVETTHANANRKVPELIS